MPSPLRPDTLANAATRAKLPPASLLAVRNWLAELLVAQEFAKLGQGGHAQNQVSLSSVFVDLPVTDQPHSEPQRAGRMLFLRNLLASKPLDLWRFSADCGADALVADFSGENQQEGFQQEAVPERENGERRKGGDFAATLLVGGPGQGKSTVTQLACQLHRAALLQPQAAGLSASQRELVGSFIPSAPAKGAPQPLGLPPSAFLPLEISLPDFSAWSAAGQGAAPSPPALLRFLASLPSASACKLGAEDLLALASQMPVLLVLDGFDEVGAQDRARIALAARELITVLGARKAQAQIIATTRPQGYAGELAQIGVPLIPRYLAPLLKDDALLYAEKLVRIKIPGADQRARTLKRIREAASGPATERLLATPLQVTILAALVQQLGRAPRERWNLFSKYFDYMYDREVERDSYASQLLADQRFHIEQIHTRVALLLQLEAESDGGGASKMPRARLEEVIDAVLGEAGVADAERKELVRNIAIAAEQRLVFLVEPEPGMFGFEIRSLQEFMAAWALSLGREVDIEARLLQVAKAPMFRNVVLFMQSKIFSEGSPLRDGVADQLCAKLDADPADEAARLTLAGAMLALEMLEEGTVQLQPKHARALMDRAKGLLTLPPGGEQLRLLRVASNDTESILRDEIERLLGAGQDEGMAGARSAWACLLWLIQDGKRNVEWAMQLGGRFWPLLQDPALAVRDCAALGIPIGPWLAGKVQERAEVIGPEEFIRLPVMNDSLAQDGSWASWLIAVQRDPNRKRFRYWQMIKPGGLTGPTPLPSVEPPAAWAAWLAAARFENDPSAACLAATLGTIVDTLPVARWSALAKASSWPLEACLRASAGPEDMRQMVKLLQSGALGDVRQWREAQQGWLTQTNSAALFESMDGLAPWSLESLKHAPPLFVYAAPWVFADVLSDLKPPVQPTAIIERTGRALRSKCLAGIWLWLAKLRLYAVRKASVSPFPDATALKEWIAGLPKTAGFLIHRPDWMPKPVWLDLLDNCTVPKDLNFFFRPPSFIDGLRDSGAHPLVLRLVVLAFFRLGVWKIESMEKLKTILNAFNLDLFQSAAARADFAILQIIAGQNPTASDDGLLGDLAEAAQDAPLLWSDFFKAIGANRLSAPRAAALLGKAYAKISPTHPAAGDAISQLRRTLQSRTSGLANRDTWRRLELPMPFPAHASNPRLARMVPQRPVALESLEVRDIRGLHHVKLHFAPPAEGCGQWVVILGPNGIGKTTLLGSLALALRNTNNPTIWPKGAFANLWQRVGDSADERVAESQIKVTLGGGETHETAIRANGSITIRQSPEQDQPRLFPLFAYGCRRGSALGGAARQVDLSDDDGPEIATLFDEGASLIHAETWLLQYEGDALKNPRSKTIFDAVIAALQTLLDVDRIDVADRKVWVTAHGRPRIPLSALSDGHLTSAGWFLDLLARWIALCERGNTPIGSDFLAQMRGLVLIDEIDLHLHPQWQIEIVTRTRRLMPQLSFIATTHNPLTLVGAKAEEIWVLTREDGRVTARSGVETPKLLTSGQIYRSYFGIEDIYPDGLGRALNRFGFLSGYALRSDAEQEEMEALQGKLKDAGLEPGWEVVPREAIPALPEAKAKVGAKATRARKAPAGPGGEKK